MGRVDHKATVIAGAARGMGKADTLQLAMVTQAASCIIYPLTARQPDK